MDKKKIIIIVAVLGLVAVLYLVALGVGLGANDGGGVSLSSIERSIGGRIERMLGGLSPRVRVNRLYCNRQRVSESFRLTKDDSTCSFDIASSEERYRKAALELVGETHPIWLKSSKPEDTDYKLNNNCVPYSQVSGTPRLEVVFEPKGEDDSGDVCWIRQSPNRPVGFVVMSKGATLTLECKGCSEDPRRELTLRMK